MSFIFRILLKLGYMAGMALTGLFAGVFTLMMQDYTLSGKNIGTQILVSTLLFAAIGLVIPWNAMKKIWAFITRLADAAPIVFRVVLLGIVILFLYFYRGLLVDLAGLWLEYVG